MIIDLVIGLVALALGWVLGVRVGSEPRIPVTKRQIDRARRANRLRQPDGFWWMPPPRDHFDDEETL